jgi:N-terminal 7TM region of histidine kinase
MAPRIPPIDQCDPVKTAAVAVTLVSSAFIAVLAVYVARHRRVAGGLPLTVVLAAGAFGYWAYAMELWTTGPARQRWGDIKYLGVVIVPPAFLAFNLAYTGRGGWLTRRLLAVLAGVPIAVLVLVAVPRTHDWVRQYQPGQLQAAFGSARLGPVGNVFVGYSAAMVLAAAGLTIFTLARISRLYRRQVTVLVIALAIPWIFNVLFTFNVSPFAHFDPTAEAFLLAGGGPGVGRVPLPAGGPGTAGHGRGRRSDARSRHCA